MTRHLQVLPLLLQLPRVAVVRAVPLLQQLAVGIRQRQLGSIEPLLPRLGRFGGPLGTLWALAAQPCPVILRGGRGHAALERPEAGRARKH